MRTVVISRSNIHHILGVSLTIFFSLLIISCDTSEDIPVQHISDDKILSDSQLEQMQQSQRIHHARDGQPHEHKTIYFGFDLRASPQEDAAQYLPFLKYLESATGYSFKLHFTSKNSSAVEELGNGTTYLAAIGATSFLEAQSKYDAISLARGLNNQNKAEYQSVFVVSPNSKIKSIDDIAGKRLAFGSIDSTQGHLIPRIMLSEKGISLNQLRKYDYTGSHQNCAEAVVSGKFDVCGMQDQLAKKLASENLIKIIHTSKYYPSSGIAASKHLSTETLKKIKLALLEFDPKGKHKQDLFHWERTEMPLGFTDASENDYADLKQWSIKLGFLKPDVRQEKIK